MAPFTNDGAFQQAKTDLNNSLDRIKANDKLRAEIVKFNNPYVAGLVGQVTQAEYDAFVGGRRRRRTKNRRKHSSKSSRRVRRRRRRSQKKMF